MNYIIVIVTAYAWYGLITMLAYMTTVGSFVSDKYDCSLMEGIGRFERAGTFGSNICAVMTCILRWPSVVRGLCSTAGLQALYDMVQENDY